MLEVCLHPRLLLKLVYPSNFKKTFPYQLSQIVIKRQKLCEEIKQGANESEKSEPLDEKKNKQNNVSRMTKYIPFPIPSSPVRHDSGLLHRLAQTPCTRVCAC